MPLLPGTNVTKAPQLVPLALGGDGIRRPAGATTARESPPPQPSSPGPSLGCPPTSSMPSQSAGSQSYSDTGHESQARTIGHASEGAMTTLTASLLRNQQESPVTPVCLARPDGGAGFGSPAEIQPQISTLPSCRLRRVTEYIEQNLDKDLPLAELAALVYMSPYHFVRLSRGSTGVPSHRFVIRPRIVRARPFLATHELSIAQI